MTFLTHRNWTTRRGEIGVVGGLNGIEAAFGITAGDIMFDDLSLYGRHNRIIGQIGLPWWNTRENTPSTMRTLVPSVPM
jgi:hypothetical protein